MERHYGDAGNQHPQAAWLCVPQIKIENDVGLYQYHTQNSVEWHSYRKSSHLMTSSSDYCENPRVTCNASYNNQNRLTHDQPNIEVLCPSVTENLSRCSSSQGNEMQTLSSEDKEKCNKPSWCEESQTDLTSCEKQHFISANSENGENVELNCKTNDDCESKQAFDLTCRNKSFSKEEDGSSDGSLVNVSDESSNIQLQARCTPKPQTCKVCGKVLSSPSSYYVHMKLHSGNKPYACTMCEASFCRKPYLEVHMRTHTGERPFECGTCNKRFTQKSSLNTHKRVHTGERPYSCDICQKTFAVKSYVTAHRWSHVSEKPLGCEHCGLTFTSKNLYALHIRTHIDQNHKCHLCGRTFMKDSYLIRHQNRVHRETSSSCLEIDEPRLEPPSRDCD